MAGLHFTYVSNEKIGSITGRKTESLAGLMDYRTKLRPSHNEPKQQTASGPSGAKARVSIGCRRHG